MRVLFVCEDPPDLSSTGNGSTLISAHLLRGLPPGVEVHLAYYDDSRGALDPAAAARCDELTALPVRSRRRALSIAPFTRLPRATWQRSSGRVHRTLLSAAVDADVVYAHGLHAFHLASAVARAAGLPLVAQEVDPWSLNWEQRAAGARPPLRWYLRGQARRAHRLEGRTGRVAARFLVVAPADAERLSQRLGRPVDALPNGVAPGPSGARPQRVPGRIGFFGTLGYAPNVEAAQVLCTRVLPLVREHVPEARVVLAGRRCGDAVRRLTAPDVEVLGAVSDPAGFFGSLSAGAYLGGTGTGTKNTLLEALMCGTPVVASPAAARGLPDVGQLLVVGDDRAAAAALVRLLTDDGERERLAASARSWARSVPTWENAVAGYVEVLRRVV